jgi:CubicO group peptidase (beta-lactamase class C family)
MLHRPTLALAALLGLGTLSASAQTLNAPKLDSLLNSLATNNKMMGSLVLSHEGKVVYSHAFGAAQVAGAGSTPATLATRYRVGSITKVFTAALIFQLIEEKKLTLDTKLATFFPQLPNAQTITIDHLLSHHSGLHSFTNDPAYPTYLAQPKTQAEMLAIMAKTTPDFAPGTKAAYSNSGYLVLGYIVEKLTKMPYAQAVQKRIVARAGLKNTYYGGKINAQKQEASSYKWMGGWQPDTETDMSIPGGAGALVSTPTDLDRFLEGLFDGRLVSVASLAAMQEVRDGFGRGLFTASFDGRKSYGHNGAIDGFRSAMSYLPADKLALALCSNGGSYSADDLMVDALKIYFGKPYRLPNFQATGYVPAAADLDRYAGTYASPQFPLKITFTKQGTTLLSQATGQSAFPLEPVSPGVFKFDPAGIQIEFAADKPTFTLKQGGRTLLLTKE